MPRFLADHNFNEQITTGLIRRDSGIEVLTARSLELARHTDEEILDFAALEEMVIVTHDRKTLVPAAWSRIAELRPMPGVVLIPSRMPVGMAVNLFASLIASTSDDEWADRVHFLSGGIHQ